MPQCPIAGDATVYVCTFEAAVLFTSNVAVSLHVITTTVQQGLPQRYVIIGRPTLVGKALSFTDELYLVIFINPPCSAVTLRTAIKCISEVCL